MIETINLENLDFKLIDSKKKITKKALQKTAEEIYPLFENGYELSFRYESKAAFAEDELFINNKLEIDKNLAMFRESLRYHGLSSDDKEYIEKLKTEQMEHEKEFPVFKGEPRRLFTFWLLSVLEIMGISFNTKYKITYYPDLFFYEKIIDYILSSNPEAELDGEDKISELFKNFTSPVDHYHALNLLLNFIMLEKNEVKEKLFDFYKNLIPKIKNKIKIEIIIFNEIKLLIRQKELIKAQEILIKNKAVLLKENPMHWIKFALMIVKYRKIISIVDMLSDLEEIKKIFEFVKKEDLYEVSLSLLSNSEFNNKNITDYLIKTMDDNENIIVKKNRANLLLERAQWHLKRDESDLTDKILKNYGPLIKDKKPYEYVELLIFFHKTSKNEHELTKLFNEEKFIKKIFENLSSTFLKMKIALLILAEVKMVENNSKKYLYGIGYQYSEKYWFYDKIYPIYIRAIINQRQTDEIGKKLSFLKKNHTFFFHEKFLNILFIINMSHEIKSDFYSDNIVSYLIDGLIFISKKDVKKIIFVWKILYHSGLKIDEVRHFSYVLNMCDYESLYLQKEKKLLMEYLDTQKKYLLKGNKKDIGDHERFLFSQFAGDLLTKSLKETDNGGDDHYAKIVSTGNVLLISNREENGSVHMKLRNSYKLSFLKCPIIDFTVADNTVFLSDRGDNPQEPKTTIYSYDLVSQKVNILKKDIKGMKSLSSIFYDKDNNRLLYNDRDGEKLRLIEYNFKTDKERILNGFSGIKHGGRVFYKSGYIFFIDYRSSVIYVIDEKNKKVMTYHNEDYKFPEGLNFFGKEIVVGFRDCGGEPCIGYIDLNDGVFKRKKIMGGAPKIDSFHFSDKDEYFVSINNKLYHIKNDNLLFTIRLNQEINTFLRIEYNGFLYIYNSAIKRILVYEIKNV